VVGSSVVFKCRNLWGAGRWGCVSVVGSSGGGVDVLAVLGALWGKSAERAGGRKNLLLSHLLDTAAVAERMWDEFLAPSTRRLLDEVAGGEAKGRRFFVWVCGVHDVGKATPAFQRMWAEGAAGVRAVGLGWHEATVAKHRWRHDRAGAHVLRRLLPGAGWAGEQVDWLWPLVAGHHGVFPTAGSLTPTSKAKGQLAGGADWSRVQAALLARFTADVGFTGGLAVVEPAHIPSRAVQLHLSGLVVMADWIASDERHFPGVDDLTQVTMAAARERAARAWERLGIRGGWGRLAEPGVEAFAKRFGGQAPRASQVMVVEAARRMPGPGLLVVEAPMGEGKTKAALLAAEVLAAKFGADGVFVGMPTQATSDPMFGNVRAWVSAIDPELASQVALLHGKRMFNKEWRTLVEDSEENWQVRFAGVDEYGECEDDDPYGRGDADWVRARGNSSGSRGPAEWFLGPKRGLLCPFVVGTIDQLLFAATRTKHVMLRMAGLAGKVVVLDEVHAADVYMSQFLKEGLRWLGQAGVPVVLLSATLPPLQRQELVNAYLGGATGREEFADEHMPLPGGYPCVTAASAAPGDEQQAHVLVEDCEGWRPDLRVTVELLPEAIPAPKASSEQRRKAQATADTAVVDLLDRELSAGGCALVIRNTVDRAQRLYTALHKSFPGSQTVLLHGRIAVGARADRTDECLRLLAPTGNGSGARPERLVLVATQLAEQSFDVDADLLVTDLAPIDLLLQRIGRLHRHDGVTRPTRLAEPRVLVTGFDGIPEATSLPPDFLHASEFIYGRHLLLRSAALVFDAAGTEGRWRIPSAVPALVESGYCSSQAAGTPPAWQHDMESAYRSWDVKERERAGRAAPYLLTRRGDKESATLAGLHYAGVSTGTDSLDALVRDGDPSLEVVLVRTEGADAPYRTLSGRMLSVNGDVPDALLDDVLGGTVRLPPRYTQEGARVLAPLPGWIGHPRLRYTRALVLDDRHGALIGGRCLRYDDELGLIEEAAE
jgi:CRISPR-associated endonuclease/helicase Cas3